MTENELSKSSVQDRGNYWKSTILRLASTYDIIPEWWSPRRDSFFRGYWYQENFLASAIYAIANRNAAFGWELTGLEDDVKYAQQLFQFAEFGAGWQQLIIKLTIDMLTQDNGGFIEVIRPAKILIDGKKYDAVKKLYENDVPEWHAFDNGSEFRVKGEYKIYDSPLDLPIGISHLDAGRCQRTGDQDVPVIYTDIHGKQHALKWWQVLAFNDMPSPIEDMNGVGYCALSRLFRSSHIMQSISLYNDEKVSGRFNRAVFLTNVDPETITDAIEMAENDASNKGLIRYSQPIVAATLSPETQVSLETINLAEIPDNFNFNDLQNWYIANLALALGVDYGFLAPLPGKGLGTAAQSETMERQSRGKSSRLFMDMLSNAINFKGVLPQSVEFQFIEKDTEEEAKQEKMKMDRAKRHEIYKNNGFTTPTVSQQMLSDVGDIPQIYVEQMGQEDSTPVVTTEGDENLESQDAQEDEMQEMQKKADYEKIEARKQTLFKSKSFFERIKNVARKTFKKKQIEFQETPNEELNDALSMYSDELEKLAFQARNGEISQSEFEKLLSDLVIMSLIAFYSQMSGIDQEDFEEYDEEILGSYINENLSSVKKLSDDIYNNRYEDTDDRNGSAMLLARLGLWVGSALALSTVGIVSNLLNEQKRYEFVLGATQEHCGDCARLNGQVHTALDWKLHPNKLPRSHSLECRGFHCLCMLIETDAPVNGSF